eukprot:c16796_g1_i1 orf=199-444(-)
MCAQNTPDNRPTMLEVVDLLKGVTKETMPLQIENSQDEKMKLETVKYRDELLEAADDGSESGENKGQQNVNQQPQKVASKE